MFYLRHKTRVQLVYFDYNTMVPLQCVALVIWKVYVDSVSSGCLSLVSHGNFFHTLMKLITY